MSTTNKSEYLLLFRGTDWSSRLSPEETQTVMSEWKTWFETLSSEGKVTGGQPLEREGKLVTGKNGRVVTDGPFAESKEAIGGYFMLTVGSMDEAVEIARGCPGLPYGVNVEVRPVADICPAARALELEAEAVPAMA